MDLQYRAWRVVLAPLEYALWALCILAVFEFADMLVCHLVPVACSPIVEVWMVWAALGVVALSVLACGARGWTAFHRGEYDP